MTTKALAITAKGRPKAPCAPKETRIPADVLDVLKRAKWRVRGSNGSEVYLLTLPQLDRALYVKVDKVLKDHGGRWNRAKAAHVFERYSGELAEALRTGAYTSGRDKGQFFTPPELAKHVVELAEIEPEMSVLEPSAGDGALIRAMPLGIDLTAVEADREVHLRLRDGVMSEVRGSIIFSDFLAVAQHVGPIFDRVVMNPPFANGQAVAHTLAAWNCLKPGGRLVAILPSGAMTNQDRKHVFFQEMVRQFGRYEDNPDGSFREAGTDVRTVTVVIDKPREVSVEK